MSPLVWINLVVCVLNGVVIIFNCYYLLHH
jgi:hypothetical protein